MGSIKNVKGKRTRYVRYEEWNEVLAPLGSWKVKLRHLNKRPTIASERPKLFIDILDELTHSILTKTHSVAVLGLCGI